MRFSLGLVLVFAAEAFGGGEMKLETLEMAPGPNMTRADLHYVKTVSSPKAALVLCPGVNGNGKDLVLAPSWQEFAKKHRLALISLSFASTMETIHDGSGYYYASKGSGDILLQGIRKIYGKDLPLILYGFSGGAHFSSRFEEWKPERVIAWCAYSAGWWDLPSKNTIAPPGVVACGEDDPRYGASMIYFKQGRAAGKPWLWISVPRTGHSTSTVLDDFVAKYFATVLSQRSRKTVWVDVDLETIISPHNVAQVPSQTAWLPSEALFEAWSQIHAP